MKFNKAQLLIINGLGLCGIAFVTELFRFHWAGLTFDNYPFLLTALIGDTISPLFLLGLVLFIIGFIKNKKTMDLRPNEGIPSAENIFPAVTPSSKSFLISSWFKFLIIAIVLILGILLGVFGFAVYQHVLPWQKSNVSQTQNSISVTTVTNSTADEAYNNKQNEQLVAMPVSSNNALENSSNNSSTPSNPGEKIFLKGVFDAMHTYLLGNNALLDGWRESNRTENGFGDVMELSLDNKIYESKEYFGKFIADIDSLKTNNSDDEHIIKLLIQAAQLKIDGITLIAKGYLIKQDRGQVRMNNMMNLSSMNNSAGNTIPPGYSGVSVVEQQGGQNPLPAYNGEVEEGTGKINIANTYYVDALKLLKDYKIQFSDDGIINYPNFDYDIDYYSKDSIVHHNE